MPRYYTRACNFYYGNLSKKLVKEKKTIPLNGSNLISFDSLELITRKSKKKISINKVSSLPRLIKKKVLSDIKNITEKKKNFSNFNFLKLPNIMGVLNLTPDSFSDGGKFNNNNKGIKHAIQMIKAGAKIIDVGGESTRPGSKKVKTKNDIEGFKNNIVNVRVVAAIIAGTFTSVRYGLSLTDKITDNQETN